MSTLSDKFVSFWELEEASGTRVDAVVATGNDLTDNNTVGQAVGKVGFAADFENDNSEYLSHANNTSLQTGDIDYSFNFWVNAESFPGQYCSLIIRDASSQREYIIFYDSVAARFTFSVFTAGVTQNNLTLSTFGALPLSTWVNINLWHDTAAGTINGSVNNGATDSILTAGPLQAAATAQFRIGSWEFFSDNRWDGLIDQVGFAKALLTTDEKTFLYNEGNGRSWAEIEAGITVATPAIAPNGGTFFAPQLVTLSDTTPNSSIYYTTDGSMPDDTDTLYTVPFLLSVDTTVKAIAYAPAMVTSAVATAVFDFEAASDINAGGRFVIRRRRKR